MKNKMLNMIKFSVAIQIAIVAISLNAKSYGQTIRATDATTPPGVAAGRPAGSYAIDNLASVNLYNGNLSFTLPILSIGGRGSAGHAITLPIKRRWTVNHQFNPGPDNYLEYSNPGDWHSMETRYMPGAFIGRQTGQGPCVSGGPLVSDTQTRLSFVSPDGTETDFISQTAGGGPLTGYCGNGQGSSRGTVFVSSDGSAATFISDSAIIDQFVTGGYTFSPSGILLFRDGTRYRIDQSRVSWIKDRNGNTITFTYDGTHVYGKLIEITDSVGRKVNISYGHQDGQYGLHDQLTFKGVGGVTRTIRISYDNLSSVLRSDQTIKTYQQLFGLNSDPTISHNPQVVSSAWLPDGRRYRFYYNSYSELARIELPTGGASEYDWGAALQGGASNGLVLVSTYVNASAYAFSEIFRQVLAVREYPDGGSGTTYSLKSTYSQIASQYATTTTRTVKSYDSSESLLAQSVHYFHRSPIPFEDDNGIFRWPDLIEGKEYQTEHFDIVNGNPVLKRRTNRTWQLGALIASSPLETTTTLVDTNQVAKTTAISPIDGSIGLDQFNNQTDVWEYDFGNGQPGQFLRRTHTDFLTDSNYTSHTGAHLRSLPIQNWVSSDIYGNSKVSLSQFEYDNYATGANHAPLTTRSNVVGHDSTSYSDSFIYRGNKTKVTSYDNAQAQTGAVSAYSQYDILGNVVKAKDAKGNVSTLDYSDRFGTPDSDARANIAPGQLNGQSTFAFATAATNPLGWTVYTQRDYYSGQPVNAEDLHGLVSKAIYNDPLDRPTQSVTAVGTALEMQANIVYDDANRRVETKSDLNALNDNLIKAEVFYDKIGRNTESRSYRDGGYVVGKTEYDALGRVKKVTTSPYRPMQNEQPVWTQSKYDAMGRVMEIETPDGSKILKSYLGNTVTITDQAGKKRKGISDALGRMIQVVEDPNGQNLVTDYTFDVVGNLRKTVQGEQSRYFMHDGLGRLLYSKQPEQDTNTNFIATDSITGNSQWSAKYLYDNNGNITSTTDAKNITVTATYDTINRLTSRDYSDATPDVNFYYDGQYMDVNDVLQTATGSVKGKITGIKSSISKTNFTGFDNLGRLLAHQQITDGQTYQTAYNYNLKGALLEETYPSGRVVKNVIDSDGDLLLVQSKKNANHGFFKYAGGFSHDSAGAITKMQLGNGRWENFTYNSRQQITQIGLGTTDTMQDVLKLEYGYGTATQNNGSMKSQKISFNGLAQPFEQTYTYDELNRLQQAKEMVGTIETWKQTFTIDRYGNREFDAANTTTLGSCQQSVCNPDINTANNRFSSSQGYGYDQNGNVTQDAQGRRFGYDAENHQKEFFIAGNSSTTPDATYQYDGAGMRVKKFSATETTIFVYSGGGKLVAEYSTALAPTQQVSYLTTDHLGSPRVITNENGIVTNRKDFSAFGEETVTAQRTEALKYQPDSVRKDYTGYEKDEESGLEFAQARYYNAQHGRFTSVDPLTASATIRNPQTFNRYSYVINSPYKFTDPLGLKLSSGTCAAESKNCGGSGERLAEGEAEHDERLDNTYDRLDAQSAADRGDMDTFWSIMRSNDSLQAFDANGNELQDSNESSGAVDVEATVNSPPGRMVGPFVLPKETVDKLVAGNIPLQGNGGCPQLPQILLNGQMGLTKEWVAGQQVSDFENGPERGTVIATMENGRYPGANTGNHVAIFLNFEKTSDGKYAMRVIEQWIGLAKPRVTTYTFGGPNTPIPKVPSAAAVSDARTYWVVYRWVPN
ncbi:MAG: BPSL0067 family protein [Pyrinomonadaceae bacterium]